MYSYGAEAASWPQPAGSYTASAAVEAEYGGVAVHGASAYHLYAHYAGEQQQQQQQHATYHAASGGHQASQQHPAAPAFHHYPSAWNGAAHHCGYSNDHPDVQQHGYNATQRQQQHSSAAFGGVLHPAQSAQQQQQQGGHYYPQQACGTRAGSDWHADGGSLYVAQQPGAQLAGQTPTAVPPQQHARPEHALYAHYYCHSWPQPAGQHATNPIARPQQQQQQPAGRQQHPAAVGAEVPAAVARSPHRAQPLQTDDEADGPPASGDGLTSASQATAVQHAAPGNQAASHAAATHGPGAGPVTVVVWDLDETLIVFNSLLNGTFVKAVPGVSPDAARDLGNRLGDTIFDFCDTHLAFEMVEHLDPIQLDDLPAALLAASQPHSAPPPPPQQQQVGDSGGGQAMELCARIASVYGEGGRGLAARMPAEQHMQLQAAMLQLDELTGGWLSAARRLLARLPAASPLSPSGSTAGAAAAAATMPQQQRQQGGGQEEAGPAAAAVCRHVLVTAGQLVGTLGKLLLFGLDEHFPAASVFSASKASKRECFGRIAARYGPAAAYVAVGDGFEEERAAAALGWGFVRVVMAAEAEAEGAAAAPGGSRLGEQGRVHGYTMEWLSRHMHYITGAAQQHQHQH